MIRISYDEGHNTVIVEFIGHVDAAQGEECFPDAERAIPRHGKEFQLLVDLSATEHMDPGIKKWIKKSMQLFNASGVARIVRVIPNPAHDVGFNIMTLFHYSPSVQVVTVPSRREAWKRLTESSDTHRNPN